MDKKTLTREQEEALGHFKSFLKSTDKVFILKGYAGTGKTTLVQSLISETDCHATLLASTGRAAKVLRDKTDRSTSTVHSLIYKYSNLEENRHSKKKSKKTAAEEHVQLTLMFYASRESLEDFRREDSNFNPLKHVYFIDESSMLSYAKSLTSTTQFGSGSLLDDFMNYVQFSKIVFIGDDCQLPPANTDEFSYALKASVLADIYKVKVWDFTLTKIIRQAAHHPILAEATRVRNNIVNKVLNSFPKLLISHRENFHIVEDSLFFKYFKINFSKAEGSCFVVCYTNKKALEINHQLKLALTNTLELKVGDWLMVYQNSITTGLVNGEHVIVREIKETLYKSGFTFVKVKLENSNGKGIYDTMLLKEFLTETNANMNWEQQQELLKDFMKRMKYRRIKPNTESFNKELREDPYINALKCKFGYAITLHKAQGGEWENLYLFMEKSFYAQPDSISKQKWLYTALTRAQKNIIVNKGMWIS